MQHTDHVKEPYQLMFRAGAGNVSFLKDKQNFRTFVDNDQTLCGIFGTCTCFLSGSQTE